MVSAGPDVMATWRCAAAGHDGQRPPLQKHSSTQRPQAAPRASAHRRGEPACAAAPLRPRPPGRRPPARLVAPRLRPRRAKPAGGCVSRRRIPAGLRRLSARLAWRASQRPAGRTSAATTPGQACRGHGWPGRR